MNAALPFWNFYTVYTLASCIVLLIMYITCRLMQRRISAFSLEQRTAEMINLHEGSNHVEPPSQTAGQSIGLTTAIIHTLPTISFKRVTKKGMSHANNECVICLDEFSEEDWLRLLPNCAHVFHLSCVDTWLRSHSTCPICRKNVIRNDSSCECSTFISVDGLMETLRREETSGGRPLEHNHVDLPTMQSAELGLEMSRSSVSESDSEESVTTVSSVTEGPNNRITTTEN